MDNTLPKLKELAERGEIDAFEDRWLSAIEEPDTALRGEMLEAIAVLARQGHRDRLATLGWSWLAAFKQQGNPKQSLELGKALLLACGESPDLRTDVIELYRLVYAGRPDLEMLIEASGLEGDKSARRALRTLELCLNLRTGDFVVERETDQVCRVVEIEPDKARYVLATAKGREALDPDRLALAYAPVGPNDFRVLVQQRPERLRELADSDPAELVIGLLQSRQGQIDSDHLEAALSPHVIASKQWNQWWSRARTALRRHPNVVIEGRNPLILTYHDEEQTLESEIEPQWARADSPLQRLNVIETYLREAKARKVQPQKDLVETMQRALQQRIACSREGAPTDALVEALVLDRLAEGVEQIAGQADNAQSVLASSECPAHVVAELREPRLFVRALDVLRQLWPEGWQALYLELLPSAPYEACDLIASRLAEAGYLDPLGDTVGKLLEQKANVDVICWLWRGPSVRELEPIPRREMLPRLVQHLQELELNDHTPSELLRNARSRIRAAFSANDYAQYHKVIGDLDTPTASTLLRTIDRAQGLGQVVRANLKRIIRQTHVELDQKPTKDPWQNDEIIYCTQHGLARYNAQLQELLKVKIPENAKAIGAAAAHGDLSENSEYKFALEERDLLHARAGKMQEDINRAMVLTARDISTDKVGIGNRVILYEQTTGRTASVTILGPWEADIGHRIYNYRAPLCGKLRGLEVGQTVDLELGDTEGTYQVQAIENALEDASEDPNTP